MAEVLNDKINQLLFFYAEEYRRNGKNFINCFIEFQSIKSCCEYIVSYSKKTGIYNESKKTGKDFSQWVRKVNVSDKWKIVLADILLLIYSLVNV